MRHLFFPKYYLKIFLILHVFLFQISHIYGQFSSKGTNAGGDISRPDQLRIVDWDFDGLGDVLLMESRPGEIKRIALYENLGEGEFSPIKRILSPNNISTPQKYTIADMDSDGDNDVVAGFDGAIGWMENIGDTLSTEIIISDTLDEVAVLDVLDLDNDGDLDIVANYGGSWDLYYFENLGDGEFGEKSVIVSEIGKLESLIFFDLNGDSFLDLVYNIHSVGETGTISNLGSLEFSEPELYTNELGTMTHMRFGDLDMDGDLDFVFSSYVLDAVGWAENDGAGNLLDYELITEGLYNPPLVEVQDIDGDGDLDVVTRTQLPQYSELLWCQNIGGGIFSEQTELDSNLIGVDELFFADLDLDEEYDVVYQSVLRDVLWNKKEGDDYLETSSIVVTPFQAENIYSGDLDDDGDLEILTVGGGYSGLLMIENLGLDGFGHAKVVQYSIQTNCRVCAGDFNGDGLKDILTVGYHDSILFWQPNLGGLEFGTELLLDNAEKQVLFTDCDYLDGDVDLDIYFSTWDGGVYWIENDGLGSFGPPTLVHESDALAELIISGDIDGDDDIDLLTIYHGEEGKIIVSLNTGDGVFDSTLIVDDNTPWGRDISLGDFDLDGDLDLVAVYDNSVVWYENIGFGTFSEPILIFEGEEALEVESQDVDLDGDLDVIVNLWFHVVWFENLDGEFYGDYNVIDDDIMYASSLCAEDLDLDGDIDVVSSSHTYDQVYFYRNEILNPHQIRGEIYVDLNENNYRDEEEVGVPAINVLTDPEWFMAFTNDNGKYFMNFEEGFEEVLEIYPAMYPAWEISTEPTSYSVDFEEDFLFVDSIDFGISPTEMLDNISVNLNGGYPRCNSEVNYWLNFRNIGTTSPSGLVHLKLDENLEFIDSELLPDSVSGNNVYWQFDSLNYFEEQSIRLNVLMPDVEFIGDTMISYLSVFIDSLDEDEILFADTLSQVLTCAYDPNDKEVQPSGFDSLGYISPTTSELEYMIRFQNTGTDTAYTVIIEDQLDTNIKVSSITLLSSSHEMDVDVLPSRVIRFNFDNIMLPDSNVNYLGSQGFVKFKVELNDDIPIGTSIFNYVSIFFDENPPIITNTVVNTLYDCDLFKDDFRLDTNKACIFDQINGEMLIESLGDDISWDILDESQTGTTFNWTADSSGVFELVASYSSGFCVSDTIFDIHISDLPDVAFNDISDGLLCISDMLVELDGTPSFGEFSGLGVEDGFFSPNIAGAGEHMLYYQYTDSLNCSNIDSIEIKVVDCLSLFENQIKEIVIVPNPFTNQLSIDLSGFAEAPGIIVIYDMLGQEIYRQEALTEPVITINTSKFEDGTYLLMITDTSKNPLIFKIVKE